MPLTSAGSERPGAGELRLHASAVVVDEAGILILGASGTGKSRLAWTLIAAAARERRHGALVGDDRILARPCHGRLVVRGAEPIAGLVEVRGAGLVRCLRQERAVVRLVVRCGTAGPRLPAPEDQTETIAGIACPAVTVPGGSDADLILWWLRNLNDAIVAVS